jgi:hypothetical protein
MVKKPAEHDPTPHPGHFADHDEDGAPDDTGPRDPRSVQCGRGEVAEQNSQDTA